MNRLAGVLLCLFFVGCVHTSRTADRSPSSLPRHVIIGVHGIGGDLTTWGSLGKVVTTHLSEINPTYRQEFYNFTYPTGMNGRNTFEFGEEDLSRYLEEVVFRDQPLQPDDKISFVAHSQGGLVVSIWYVDTLVSAALKQEGRYRKDIGRFEKYANQVDSIVTVGTPFWGSKLATRFSDKTVFDPTKPFGIFNPEEMKEMAFGSNTIYQFRRSTIALSQKPELRKLFKARMVNIAGMFPKDDSKLYYKSNPNDRKFKITKAALDFIRKKFLSIGFGGSRYEADVAVLVPSSRMKFLYADDLSKSGPALPISGQQFKEADYFTNSEWYLTESIHSPVLPSYTVGMAYIPEECIDLKSCRHPTYPYILRSLANCSAQAGCDQAAFQTAQLTLNQANPGEHERNLKMASELQGFEIEVVLRMPDLAYDIENPKFKSKPGVRFYTSVGLSSEGDNDLSDQWVFAQNAFYKECVRIPKLKDGQVVQSSDLVQVHVAESKEYLSKLVTWQEMKFGREPHKDLRLHMTGYIRPSAKALLQKEAYENQTKIGFDVPIEFELPGLVKRSASIRVRPGYSSYLELQMQYAGSH